MDILESLWVDFRKITDKFFLGQTSLRVTSFCSFYLPHMEYEGSIGLVSRKMKKIFGDFNFFGLFIYK
jgi:hypothetical protein